jgi:hypothetical protein
LPIHARFTVHHMPDHCEAIMAEPLQDDDNEVLQRAEALLRRHRSAAAPTLPAASDVPLLTDAVEIDPDVAGHSAPRDTLPASAEVRGQVGREPDSEVAREPEPAIGQAPDPEVAQEPIPEFAAEQVREPAPAGEAALPGPETAAVPALDPGLVAVGDTPSFPDSVTAPVPTLAEAYLADPTEVRAPDAAAARAPDAGMQQASASGEFPAVPEAFAPNGQETDAALPAGEVISRVQAQNLDHSVYQ